MGRKVSREEKGIQAFLCRGVSNPTMREKVRAFKVAAKYAGRE